MGRRRGLIGLLTAETISMVGSRMSALALPWFVLTTTGSAGKAGVTAFAEMLPYVVACAFGGPLIDRAGPRRVTIAADAASAVAVVAIPVLHARGLGFAGVVALVAATGVLRGFGDIAKRSFFTRVVRASGVDMTRAASLQDGLARLATLLGAPAGGLLIAALDAPAVLAIDAASFAAAALLIAVSRPAPGPSDGAENPGHGAEPYLRALRAGAGFIRRDRVIGGIVLMLAFTNLFDAAYTSVLIPVWAERVIGSPVVLGLLAASFAIGAVLGNAAFTALAPRAPRFALFALAFIVGGAPRFLAAALTDRVWLVCGVSFVAGLAIAAVNPIIGAVCYERIPEPMMARVQGLSTAVAWVGIPVGGLLGGWLAEAAGLRAALVGFGAAYLLVSLAPLVWRRTWRRLDDRPAPREAPAPDLAMAP
jgi:predicted MFS family arabinose efflux permease